jgi:hypothetical protein
MTGLAETAGPGPAHPAPECPFPGPASYDYDGNGLFFGRDEEISTLTSMILSSRLTVLTAGSGDGKTSLIHAGLAPLLLREGIEIAVAEPGSTAPLADVAIRALPRLSMRRSAATRLVTTLIERLDEDSSLRTARTYCRDLSRSERQLLLDGEGASRPTQRLTGGGLVTWLRDDSIGDDYLERAMVAAGGLGWLGPDAPLHKILAFVRGLRSGRRGSNLGKLDAQELFDLMRKEVVHRRDLDDEFQLVLVIDQFEEIFTQVRSGGESAVAAGYDPVRNREELLRFVDLVTNERWPVRLLLSLRKEHYTDLQVLLADSEKVAGATYHLAPLGQEQAAGCLRGPELWPVEPPTPQQAEAVAAALSSSDGTVSPTLLSVAGEWLWRLADLPACSPKDLQDRIPTAVDDFLSRALGDYEDSPPFNALEEQEILDILEQLVVRDGSFERRDSVAVNQLVAAPFRRPELRQRLLDELQRRRLVRRATSLGRPHVEILHEQLIKPLRRRREKLRRDHWHIARLPELLDDLRAEARGRVMLKRHLDKDFRNVLAANIDRLSFPPALAARTLLRILWGRDLGGETSGDGRPLADLTLRKVIRQLADYARRPEPPPGQDDDSAEEAIIRIEQGRLVSSAEADHRFPHDVADDEPNMLGLIFASCLVHRDTRAADRLRDYGGRLRKRHIL